MYAITYQHFRYKYLICLFLLENAECFEHGACMLSAIVSYTFQWDMGYRVKSTQQTIAYINN